VKLHATPVGHLNTVTAYGDGYVRVNDERHETSVIIRPEGSVCDWPVTRFETLDAIHFASLLEYRPELVVFGSGVRLRFPHPRLTRALGERGIGLETMDLFAACRTYNILMAEGRKVVAALLIERPQASA